MQRNRILELVESWDAPMDKYWISVNSLSARMRHTGQILIGPESKTIEEIEKIAADIRADLEQVVEDARERIANQGPHKA